MDLTKDIKTHIIITMSGGKYYLTQRLHSQLRQMSLDDMVETFEGSMIKVSTIAEVLTIDEYEKHYPQKQSVDAKQPYQNDLRTLEDIVAKYHWASIAYKFPNMFELVVLTHKRMTEFKGTFEEFCVKHKALTPAGDVIPAVYTDDKGNQHSAVFAYAMFCDVNKLIQERKAKQAFASEQSWDDILADKGQPLTQSFIDQMAEWYERNPDKKETAGGKYFQEHLVWRAKKLANAKK